MLSEEALRERAWEGLSYLRSVFEPFHREFGERLGSISSTLEGDFDRLRSLMVVAALVSERRDVLLAAVAGTEGDDRSPEARRGRATRALAELRRVEAALRYLESHAAALSAEIGKVCSGVDHAKDGRTGMKE